MLSKSLQYIFASLLGLLVALPAHGQSDFSADYTYPEDNTDNLFVFSKADTNRLQCHWTDADGDMQVFFLAYPASRDEAGVTTILDALATEKDVAQIIQTQPRWALRLLDALAAWDHKRPFIGLIYDEKTDLWYSKDIKTTNAQATIGAEVLVHLKGYLENGRVFEDSYKRGDPVKFTLGESKHLPAVEQAITLFRGGESGTVRLPAEKAFGGRGAGNLIPPGSTVYYDIELLKVYE